MITKPHQPTWYGENLSKKAHELGVMFIYEDYTKEEALNLVKEIKEIVNNLEKSVEFHGGSFENEDE